VAPVLDINRWTHSVSLLGTASLGHQCLRHPGGLALKAPTLGPPKGKVVGLTLLTLSPKVELAQNGSIAGSNLGSGSMTAALSGFIPGTGNSGSIAGQESDNSGFVYESGRVLSMPTRGHVANAASLTG
jgi:hypothetical protein